MDVHTAAVVGASGYAGGEVVRLLDDHPHFSVAHLGANTQAGRPLAEVHPHLDQGERILGGSDPNEVPEVDVVFLALPHGASWATGKQLAERGSLVVDLGSDYRLDTDRRYQAAYGSPHPAPDDLDQWAYGLPELFDLRGARRIASPGCYPTAVLLAFAPLLREGLVETDAPVVADCMSGVSGAGRGLKESLLFGSVAEGVQAYKVTEHRHRPEIEMGLGRYAGSEPRVVFTPHLVPMQRGELATVTAPLRSRATATEDARDVLRSTYSDSPFVEVIDVPPQTRWAVSSNRAFVTAFVDEHAGVLIAQGAIDNLVKGAAGQAVQASNVALGLPETAGLPTAGWMP